MNNKIVIIGCGNVGMSYAYALLNQRNSVNELVLIDINKQKALGEAMDLNHGLAFAPTHMNIKAGDYSDCQDATIVVIAAGANQEKGETRMDLIDKNNKIFESIVKDVIASGFNGIFLVATNPVDIMTYITWKHSGFDTSKVIGTGTTLDTARLRYEISKELNINSKNVHAYVIGEHGDSELVAWSNCTIGLQNIKDFLTDEQKDTISNNVKNAAYEIIDKKGNTSYGIGISLVKITNSILENTNSILTVSSYDKNNNVFIGTPTILNKNGVSKKIYIDLTKTEEELLESSINIIKEAIKKISD